MCKTTLSICCLLFSMNVSAITLIPTSELPSDIQSCFQSSQCTSSDYYGNILVSQNDAQGVAALQYTQQGVNKWLLRYELLSPPGTASGVAWLTGQDTYDIANSDTHEFALYHDSLPFNPYYGATTLTLTLNDNDLADGSAYNNHYYEYGTPPSVTGDLITNAYVCFDGTCRTNQTLNLLNINYIDGVFSFNAADSRGLLYLHEDIYYNAPSYNMTALYAHPVPLPASALLFASGLFGGALGMRRRKSSLAT